VTLCFAMPLYPPSSLQERRSLRYPNFKFILQVTGKIKNTKRNCSGPSCTACHWLTVGNCSVLYSVTVPTLCNDSVYIQPVSLLTRNDSIYIQPITYWLLLTIPFVHSHLLTRNGSIYVQPVSLLTLVTISFHMYKLRWSFRHQLILSTQKNFLERTQTSRLNLFGL
jgi:hypothetical protein